MFPRNLLPCLLKALTFATVLLSFATVLLAQTCARLKPKPTGVVDDGQDRHKVSQFLDFSLERCVLECILLSACASLEYRESQGLCELGNVTAEDADSWDSENTNRYVFVYHDIRNMNWEVAGSCASRPCAENQRCIMTQPFMCVDVDCGPPPIEIVELSPYTFHVTGSSVSTSLGSKAKYSCGGAGTPFAFAKDVYNPRVPFYKSPFKICSSDFTWTNNRHDCLLYGLRDCEGVKTCDPSLPDGHYLIYKSGIYEAKVKVYCHDMADKPKTYITVPSTDNVAYNAGDGITGPTMTTFSKIRVMGDNFDVDPSDFTFATTTGPLGNISLGEAGSCHGDANKTAYGYFRINTPGTGVHIDTGKGAYKSVWTTSGGSELVDVMTTDSEVTGRCRGPCGRCYTQTLSLTSNRNQQLDLSDTVRPICV